ncbi:ABC transporter substrate-binding protein [Actinocorallia sp. A-T 12471]|uniref:ABC transporter substrate-binding protein n=1 Tax=Actinocorallia sp. A-T 12471 TaxID=3089813 RepID=UPI0029D0678B|nr:ABC transporter substrate-binding protein [Actinocorallia sp. A-T 12471]MDX6743125.1 ABC transporter substrate-binding protein [Actinocorallia sp. A-T 12471]
MRRTPVRRTARRGRRIAALSVALVALPPLASCAAGEPADDGDGTARPGGTLTFAVASDAGCADPHQVGSSDTLYSLRQTVDSLTDQDPATGEIVPWLAESWRISADAKTFTFVLRPGVTFSDGTPLDAAAVKASFDAIPKLGALAVQATAYLDGYTGTKVVDDRTAEVSFERPNAQFLQATTTPVLSVVSPKSADKSPQERCTDGVVGTGPFVLAEYAPNQSATLTRRDDYAWGSSLWKKKGAAYLDKLVFTVVPESGVRTGGLTSGQVDAIGRVAQAEEAAIKGAGAGLVGHTIPGVGYNLGLNSDKPALRDVRVRQAIRSAVHRQQIVETVFSSGTKPATSVLAENTPGYTDLSADLSYDPARAKSLLDAAGWTPGPDGIRVKDGEKLTLKTVWFNNVAVFKPALELLQQQLKDVGVDLALTELQVSQFPALLKSGDFDAFWGGNYNRADPDALRTLYSTRLNNAYRIPATGLDALLDRQAAEADPARRADLVAEAQRLIVENAYVVPVVDQRTVLGVSAKVHDLAFAGSGDVHLHDTWKS